MTAARQREEVRALRAAVSMLQDELRGFRRLRKTPGELEQMLHGIRLTREEASSIVGLWYELDKCLYFGLEFCDLRDVRKYHEKLRKFVEQKQLDSVCCGRTT